MAVIFKVNPSLEPFSCRSCSACSILSSSCSISWSDAKFKALDGAEGSGCFGATSTVVAPMAVGLCEDTAT